MADEQEVKNDEENTAPVENVEPEAESNDTPDPAETEDQPASSADKEAEVSCVGNQL